MVELREGKSEIMCLKMLLKRKQKGLLQISMDDTEEAALVVIYLQFPIQVYFSWSANPSPTLLPSPTTLWF